jgi:hypothetical protein
MLDPTGPAREAVVSWNTRALEGTLELRVNAHDGRTSAWLPYATFAADRRTSLDGARHVRAPRDRRPAQRRRYRFDRRANARRTRRAVREPARLRCAVLDRRAAGDRPRRAGPLAIRRGLSERARLVRAGGARDAVGLSLVSARPAASSRARSSTRATAARETGRFNVAFAGSLGFRAAVAALARSARTRTRFSSTTSRSRSRWPGSAANSPARRCRNQSGHLVVLRGIDASGDALVNDPAQPGIAVAYPRAAFERAWLGHGGIALAVAPAPLGDLLVRLANA